eukprot:NODE_21_length_38511_cov_0.503306.p8 type:complete len:415 gc:universal NODE_21_length_38511_cov_0.503306:34092-32848(-)
MSYPMLKMPDLISILATFNVHLQQDDIIKPKTLLVQNTIQSLMYLITGKQIQQLEDTLQMITIFKQSQRIIKLFVPEYSFNDLLKPESSKFRKILCGSIHFLQLKMDLQSGITETVQNVQMLVDNKEIYNDQKIQLEQELTKVKKSKELEMVEIAKCEQENTELTNKLKDFKKQQVKFTTHLQQLKLKKTALNDEINGIDFKTLTVNESIELINSKRIEDMEVFMNNLENLKTQITELKSKSVNQDQQYLQLHGRYNVLQDINHYFNQLNGILNECKQLVTENKNLSLNRAQSNQLLHDKQLEHKNIDIKLQQMQRQYNSMQERTNKLNDQIKDKQRIGNMKLHNLQTELTVIQNGETETSKEVARLEEQCHLLRLEITQLERKIESEQSELDYHLRELKEVVVNYTSSIQKEI